MKLSLAEMFLFAVLFAAWLAGVLLIVDWAASVGVS